jgi:hypothetical protein
MCCVVVRTDWQHGTLFAANAQVDRLWAVLCFEARIREDMEKEVTTEPDALLVTAPPAAAGNPPQPVQAVSSERKRSARRKRKVAAFEGLPGAESPYFRKG